VAFLKLLALTAAARLIRFDFRLAAREGRLVFKILRSLTNSFAG